ncbi:Capsule polysaccharide export protein [Rubrivivax sp. A210]|uniref:polysaccharide export protein EpsE n=1 Tax=Rubrivivax sp. A210 TaxID=2772301 RepID=UPI00191820D0|nr:polysaccharide export protein EpsE [Rubrivivax sp. A210]CAD5369200.1 Capsule polysaccharide export protein [Rubrivivax sp. A210]
MNAFKFLSRCAGLAMALLMAGTAPAQGAGPEYRLGAGDVVRITVYQNPDLSLEGRISESGAISYPLLGVVKLGGLSVGAAEKTIADGLRLGNFVKQPQVSVLPVQVRGNQASVLGQANRPGRFPIEVADMRLTDLLALAGGISAAGGELVVVSGVREGKPFRKEVDLPSVFASPSRELDIPIQNGDVVWIDRAPTAYIYGEVQRPGPLRVERGMTLMQALATGGGLTQRGTLKDLKLHRRGAEGKTQVLQPSMDDRLQEGDVVYVKESLF